jgi:hypothetical protein
MSKGICKDCKGTGRVKAYGGHHGHPLTFKCDTCKGKGRG